MSLQAQLRSFTSSPKITAMKTLTKSTSTPQLGAMAAAPTSPQTPSALFRSESEGMNTIPDPRAPTPNSALSRTGSTDSSSHPDLSVEVAMLSTKLVNAINNQTTLDDSLQHTRHELEAARERIAQLEAAAKEHADMIDRGLLIDKAVYDKMETQLLSDLAEERKRRIEAEKAKKKVDAEVEALTTALFEEANKMVAAARKDTEASEKRNEQLKQQLSDNEVLLASQQDQLQDLKTVMAQLSSDRDENETNTYTTTAPSTPGLVPADKMGKLFENLTPNTPGSDEVAPDHPLHFSHLLYPVLRSDLPAFRDFQEMFKTPSKLSSAPPSRATSGNYGSFNVLGLGSLTGNNNSTTSLPSTVKAGSASGSPRESVTSPPLLPNLKDEKFYKRSLIEDIEPTLRLETAPGLSWMVRRTVLNSITSGSLVIEPHPPPPKFRGPVFPCALCGESRKGDQYTRKFRFKLSDTDEAQKYPLCDWCLGRMRSTCDYIGFLRMVAAGHWRAESEDAKKSAWEEASRLRERMFWARLGGGVVPAFIPSRESPRSPTFPNGSDKQLRKSEESQDFDRGLDSAIGMNVPEPVEEKDEEDPFQSNGEDQMKRVSIGKTVISSEDKAPLNEEEEKKIEEAVEVQLQNEIKHSVADIAKRFELNNKKEPNTSKGIQQHLRSKSSPGSPPKRLEKESRLSVTIPGAFE